MGPVDRDGLPPELVSAADPTDVAPRRRSGGSIFLRRMSEDVGFVTDVALLPPYEQLVFSNSGVYVRSSASRNLNGLRVMPSITFHNYSGSDQSLFLVFFLILAVLNPWKKIIRQVEYSDFYTIYRGMA